MAVLPSLFDRADGGEIYNGSTATGSYRDGIATPEGVILVRDNGTISDLTDAPSIKLRELSTSPTVERAEQATITKIFQMDWEEGINRLATMGRGAIMVSESGDVTRVLSSSLQRERGGYCTLTVVAEAISFDSPPDEFDVQPVELGVHIIKHPRYFHALNPASTDDANFVTVNDIIVSLSDIKQTIIRAIQAYMDAPFYPAGGNINGMFQTNIMSMLEKSEVIVDVAIADWESLWDGKSELQNGQLWDGDTSNMPDGNYSWLSVPVPSTTPGILLAVAAAKEIISKIWRQEEQPYTIGYQMTWSQYYFRPPAMSPGGYVEDPIWNGYFEVPDYFISTEWPPDRDFTIFDRLPFDNPQCYSVSGTRPAGEIGVYNTDYVISWLRKADKIEYQRTWFKITRTWLGAPIGIWDTELYSGGDRPTLPEHYVTQFLSLGST